MCGFGPMRPRSWRFRSLVMRIMLAAPWRTRYAFALLRGYQRSHIRELVAPGFCNTPLGAWVLDLFSENAHQLSGKCIAQIFRAREACGIL